MVKCLSNWTWLFVRCAMVEQEVLGSIINIPSIEICTEYVTSSHTPLCRYNNFDSGRTVYLFIQFKDYAFIVRKYSYCEYCELI